MNENNFDNSDKKTKIGDKKDRSIFNRIFLWLSSFLIIILAVWGILKIAGSLSPNNESIENLPILEQDWIKGNKNSRVVLIEYSDFECPACAMYASIVNQIVKEFGDKIVLAYRHFPLKDKHKNAELAAYFTEAAGRQGKFWEMHDVIFEKQAEWAEKNNAEDLFIEYAKKLSLDVNLLNKDINSEEIKNKVDNDFKSGISAKVNYTPTLFLNGKKISPESYEDFKNIISQAIGNN